MKKGNFVKKILLDGRLDRYKANLHCHTVLSDGKKTPEQIKKDYLAHGYSIVAFTDHDKYYPHNDLTDDRFIALDGFDLEYYRTAWRGQTCHLCFIAKDPENRALGYSEKEPPIFIKQLPEGGLDPEKGGELYRVTCPGRKYSAEYINADIARAKELGFYVTYNHPTWSLESYPDYTAYKGMDAMEICNYGCVITGYGDINPRAYEDLLRTDHRLFCISTDDNHNDLPDADVGSDSYGGYTVIYTDRLDYPHVIRALENGSFCCCAGTVTGEKDCPEIRELWAEDGRVHIRTSPVRSIELEKDIRPFGLLTAKKGEAVTEADFEIGTCKWFRFTLTGDNGCRTFTNAYFTDSL